MPRFDGETYDHARDEVRLTVQLYRVWDVVLDGRWHTLGDISRRTGDPTPSVSARLRDLRKKRFGGHRIDRRYVGNGLFQYRYRA